MHKKLKEIQAKIGPDRLLIVFRNWPIPYHKHAAKLAVAARCAGLQGKFWPYADKIFAAAQKANDDADEKARLLGTDAINEIADDVDLDLKLFRACCEDPSIKAKIDADADRAKELGGKGTPFILVGGVPFAENWLKDDTLEKFLLESLAPLERK